MIFFSASYSPPNCCPTPCAAEAEDSAAFSSFFYTRTESCSRSFVHARLVVEPVETHPQVSPNGDRPQAVRQLSIIKQ